MKLFLSISLSFLLVLQALALPVQQHWCQGKLLALTTLDAEYAACTTKVCHAPSATDPANLTNCTEAALATESCCQANAQATESSSSEHSLRAAPCCVDRLSWNFSQIHSISPAQELAVLGIAPAAPLWLPVTPIYCLSLAEAAVANTLRGPPSAKALRPHSQQRAWIQVYQI